VHVKKTVSAVKSALEILEASEGLTEGSKARELAKIQLRQAMADIKNTPPRALPKKQRRRWHQGVELAPMAGAKRDTYNLAEMEEEAEYQAAAASPKPEPSTRTQPQWALDAMLSESKRSDDDDDDCGHADDKPDDKPDDKHTEADAAESFAMLMKAARGLVKAEVEEHELEARKAHIDDEADAAMKAAMAAMGNSGASTETPSALQIMMSAAEDEELIGDRGDYTQGTTDDIEKTLAAMDSFPELSLDSDEEYDDFDESFSETMDAESLQREMELLEEMEKLDGQEHTLKDELESQHSDLEANLSEQEKLQKQIDEALAALAEAKE